MTSTPAHVALTLDGAQERPDWSVSGHAMRWTPPEDDRDQAEPEDELDRIFAAAPRLDVGAVVRTMHEMVGGQPLTEWQSEVLRQAYAQPRRRWDPRGWWRR